MLLAGRLLGLGLVAFAALFLVRPRRVDRQEAIRFNDAIVASAVPVFVAGRDFARAALAAMQGAHGADIAVQLAFDTAERALARTRSAVSSLMVPDCSCAHQFLDAYLRLLDAQERIIRDDFAVIIAILRDAALPPALRYNRVARIAHTVASVDREAMAVVKRAQHAFSVEHGFRIA